MQVQCAVLKAAKPLSHEHSNKNIFLDLVDFLGFGRFFFSFGRKQIFGFGRTCVPEWDSYHRPEAGMQDH